MGLQAIYQAPRTGDPHPQHRIYPYLLRSLAITRPDQGSQFTSFEFTGVLKEAEITIPMDGRGRCMDNVFIERLWRSLKYEAIYLHELTDGFKAERVIGEWINFYNTEQPHSSFGGQAPAEVYEITQRQQDVINRVLGP
jgi:putative transposase